MKCMYYLVPNLVSTHQVSLDLGAVGVDDWYVHVISKDEAGLKNEKIHSSNWLETTDLLRFGFIGANFGFIIGVLIAGGLLLFEPFGPDFPTIAYFFMVAVATGFPTRGVGQSNSAPPAALPSSWMLIESENCSTTGA